MVLRVKNETHITPHFSTAETEKRVVEKRTGYNFFSNIPSHIQEKIEKNRKIFWDQKGDIPDDFAPGLSASLMAEEISDSKISDKSLLKLNSHINQHI
ncbi:hypothetical protein H6G81_14095 [Scytonema hofmannii FACHB-248]|uniref:Uncharacterized protein n=1 Tax=Scytonema hofmannii FACHB-248 TaxID=1842502 RepID=A0ABR8GQK4_9CYAN|nr:MULTISPECIES: hypothetical protein [Nostocales]MBD2605628.1 hypothetical protein [Scytonema hofmannii FACHB-248]